MEKNKEKNFASAVVYVYNNADDIFEFLQKLHDELELHFEKYEIICVNDNSTDHSVSEIKRFSKTVFGGMISVLNMSFFQGIEMAMNAGVDLSIGDFVYEFDTIDMAYPIELIFDVYKHSLSGYDIVSAAPITKRRMSSKIFYAVYNRLSNTQFPLQTESFRILSRRAINRVHSMSKTIPYRKAVYANCGLKIDSLTYDNSNDIVLRDKKTWKNQKNIAIDALILYSDGAYRFSMALSSVMMMITILIGIYTVCIYLGGQPVAGWTTTMLFLAFGFLGVFAILTIAIKYMSILLGLSFNRQKYVMESIEKLKN